MLVLSLQGPNGGSTFPARGLVSGYWYSYLGNANSAALRSAAGVSLILALVVGVIASALSLSLIMAYRRMSRRVGRAFLYLILLSLMTPGILLSLGMSLWWKLLGLNVSLYPAGLGVQVAWALPFGFLVMLAIFNRYDIAVEEAARDLGASAMQTFTRVTLPIIWGGVFGAALFGFTLSWNEFERTLLVSPTNTLPLEIYGELVSSTLEPNLYALGVITTFGTILLVFLMLVIVALLVRRTARTQAAALAEDHVEAIAAMPALEAA
jgi:putative spermidine/putrescine transport system permease protein